MSIQRWGNPPAICEMAGLSPPREPRAGGQRLADSVTRAPLDAPTRDWHGAHPALGVAWRFEEQLTTRNGQTSENLRVMHVAAATSWTLMEQDAPENMMVVSWKRCHVNWARLRTDLLVTASTEIR